METENTRPSLVFACEWYYNRKKSWSGTHLSIFNALKRYYEVTDFNMGSGFLSTAIRQLSRRIGFQPSKHNGEKANRRAQQKFANTDVPIFQFGDTPDIGGCRSFVYQDLSWLYLERLYRENPSEFQYSGFNRFNLEQIHNNALKQDAFYRKDNCAAILAMGHWYEKFLLNDCRLPRDKVYHIGGGCNLNALRIDGSKKIGNKILFVGKAFERKNGPLVVEAFRILKKQLPEAELYIAGPKRLAIDGEGIHCLGELNTSQLSEYFNLCDIFCMPSIFEAYGLVFAEALTYGLPCIGRDAYEMPYFIEQGETGYLLKSQSAEELAKLMRMALENSDMKKNVQSKRNFYIEEYSWDRVASRAQKIIESKR